jgi:hypothetical protein
MLNIEKDKYTESFFFPDSMLKLVEGEKNKVTVSFLNQLDLKYDSLINKYPLMSTDILETKMELRRLFLDSINGFSRLSKKLLNDYIDQSSFFEKLMSIIDNK